jgi:phage terminase large subunit-like protein
MTDIEQLLEVLTRHQVEFIVIGGVAAIAHGAARVTYDLDVVYERAPANLARIVQALEPFCGAHRPDCRLCGMFAPCSAA